MFIILPPHHHRHVRAARRRPAPASRTRYTLLRLPRRVLRADPKWFAPGLGETTGQAPLELHA
jgi:hypothetical protein